MSLQVAADGTEIHYPKKWTHLNTVTAVLLVISFAECFRDSMLARFVGVIGVLLCTIVTGYPLRNAYMAATGKAWLKVSRDGISARYGKAACTLPWRDIKGFSVVDTAPPHGKLIFVGISLNDDAVLTEEHKRQRRLGQKMSKGAFDGIPLRDLYDWTPKELADYLNSQKERYSRG